MITKKIPYHDLDGDPQEDVFYFSLNEAQFARLNGEFPGGLEAYASRVAKDKNANEMFRIIDTLVQAAYGERIDNRFVKKAPNGQPLVDFFVNTEAYDHLMQELVSSEDALINFLVGCLGTEAQARARENFEKIKAERALSGKLDSLAGTETANLHEVTNPT